MELDISQISMITNFEAGVNCIENPSLISRFFSLSGVTIVCSFWQWGAIILAILATFSSILKRIKVIHIRRLKSSSESLLHHLDIDLDLTDDDTDDSSRVSSDIDDDDEPTNTASFSDEYDDFVVKGSNFFYNSLVQNGNLRLLCNRRGESGEGFCWPDFSSGKNVVKLWDSLGLSLCFDSFDDSSDSESVVSLWDLDQEKKINDIFGCSSHLGSVSAAATQSRSVVLSAEMNDGRNGVVWGAYDTRMGGKKPAIYAEWGSPAAARKVVGVKQGGVEKVYVRDDASGVVTVGDVRRVKTPLETVSEADGDMWCDADAVGADDEFFDCSK